MRKFLLSTIGILCSLLTMAQEGQMERLKAHVYYLASDDLQGRKAGSASSLKAADYLCKQYQEIGAKPYFENYMTLFSLKGNNDAFSMAMATSGDTLKHYRNVAIIIPGSDPVLGKEFILMGAHYDHLGVKGGQVYNGADDNASGSAAVVEVARQLMARKGQLKRSVVIANFDAEEIGLCGSSNMASMMEQMGRLEDCKLMMSIDMVGWYKASGHLILEGSGTIKHGDKLLQQIAEKEGIVIRTKKFENSVFTATDTEPFAKHQIPTLAVTTGIKSPYHKPEDDADLIDYEGMDKIVNYLTELAVRLSNEPTMVGSGKVAAKHSSKRPFMELGLNLSGGRSHITLPDLALSTDYGWGWNGGLSLSINPTKRSQGVMDTYWTLVSGVYYDRFWSPYPSNADFWNGPTRYQQQSINVPLVAKINIGTSSQYFYVGAGAYYQYMLGHSFEEDGLVRTINDHQFGWVFNIGMRMGKWDISSDYGHSLGSLMDVTKTSMSRRRFSVTYWLW